MSEPIITPPTPSELPEEFKKAIKLDRFHRYAIAADESGPRAYFGLVGEDGSHNYYWAELGALDGVAFNLGSIAQTCHIIADGGGLRSQMVPFETTMVMSTLASDVNAAGHLEVSFCTMSGAILTTTLRPEIAGMLAEELAETMAQLPEPVELRKRPLRGAAVQGVEHSGKTVTYFGQAYRPAILQAFGVLMVRANLMDRSLINLLAVLSGLSPERAEAAYYSSINFKARTDLVRSQISLSPLPDSVKGDIDGALEKANNVAGRRNDLVHAVWRFEKDRFTAENHTPNKKTKKTVLAVTDKSILDIAATYRSVGISLDVSAASAANHIGSMARNASATPSSGEPSI